jgi:hypothetical protein
MYTADCLGDRLTQIEANAGDDDEKEGGYEDLLEWSLLTSPYNLFWGS